MRKNYDENIEKDIKQYLKNEADKVSVPEGMFFKVRGEILRKEEKGVSNMKSKFLNPKTILIAGIICVLTTVTCVAATDLSGWYGSSSKLTETTTFPDKDEVNEKVGFTPKYIKEFSNGFKFESFNYSNEEMKNEKGEVYEKNKRACFDYTKGSPEKNQCLRELATKIDEQYLNKNDNENVIRDDYRGIEIEYISNKYKVVPESYQPTQEEKELCDKGLLQIGYGVESDEIEESNTQYVSWYEDGMSYSIMNFNYDDLSKDDMINMAKEIIDQN